MKTHIYLKWSDEIGDSALVWRADSDLEGIAKLDALQDWIGMLQAEYVKAFDAMWHNKIKGASSEEIARALCLEWWNERNRNAISRPPVS